MKVTHNIPLRSHLFLITELALIFITLTILKKTDSYYSIYLLIGLLGSIATYKNIRKIHLKTFSSFFSGFFALCVSLANYHIFAEISSPGGIWLLLAFVSALLVFSGSFVIFQNLLISLKQLTIKNTPKILKDDSRLKFFLTCLAIFIVIDLTIFFSCFYPGVLTFDSLDEINQILTDTYSNHHPFYFTLLIKFFVSIGLDLFHDINFGIALFSIFQILVLSSAFSYSLLTLFEKGVSKKLLLCLTVFIALLPFNIMYSFTMWKDVLFGAFFLILVVSIYRYFSFSKSRHIITLILIFISTIIISLFRSNAFIAILVSIIIFFLIFKKSQLKLGYLLIGAILFAFILKTPVLKALNIQNADNLESLAIPMQQVTRVIVEQKDNLSAEDLALISNLADPSALATAYNPVIHDPVKNLVRLEGDKQYLTDHKSEFIWLYIRLGLKYPSVYLKAWIDQTRGYWNSGYSYWKWSTKTDTNNLGITQTTNPNFLKKGFDTYLELFEKTGFLNPLISIGLAVWLLLSLFYLALIRKNSNLTFIFIPFIAVWGTLLIATPVFSEFRYIYFLFTCLPFLTVISLIKKEKYEKR